MLYFQGFADKYKKYNHDDHSTNNNKLEDDRSVINIDESMMSTQYTQKTLKAGYTLQNGKYEIVKVLGQGGFGITYLAVHTFLGKRVAVKEFFPKDFCDRDETTSQITLGTANTAELVSKLKVKFLKEAKNIAKLNHPNIVSIQDIFEENNTAYYLMDYIEGESLGDKIKRNGAMTEALAVKYIRQVCSAIAYMHSKSMNHLDIKPANIMVRKTDDMPILIDFGTSKQYDSEGEQTSTMAPGFTHGYAPVEQYKPGGVAIFTPQTDIYALGATLYALLTGDKPPHYSEILEDGLPDLPLAISEATKKGVEHAMEIRKNKRPSSISEFLSLFTEVSAPILEEVKNNLSLKQNVECPQFSIKEESLHPSVEEDEDTIFASVVSLPKSKFNDSSKTTADAYNIIIDDCSFVDLGLSVLWANQNIGAKRPEDLGTFINKQDVSTNGEVAEWNLKGTLIPTIGQFEELRSNCNWECTEQKGVGGYKITGRTGNSIFIPFSGDNCNNPFRIFGRLFTREAF